MEKISQLLGQLGIELSEDAEKQLGELVGKELSDAADKIARLSRQLDEMTAKYSDAAERLAHSESDFAAERLLSGCKFVSERVRNSVLDELRAKRFPVENGELVGGREFLDELKRSEPDAFAKENPPLFMSGTQSGVPADANNLEAQILSGFGLTD